MSLSQGGYDDQPAEWVDAIIAVQAAYNRAQNELQEDIEKQEAKKNKRR